MHKVKVQQLAQWKVIITTFLTALTIKDKLIKEKASLHFSHIIIDEGAQSREPEALGALVLAEPNTHIVIAGDHRQVSVYALIFPCECVCVPPEGEIWAELVAQSVLNTFRDNHIM